MVVNLTFSGNKLINELLTQEQNVSLRVDLESCDGEAICLIYISFLSWT